LIETSELPLPPKNLRWGGPRFADDAFFLHSGLANVRKLENVTGLNADARVLDIGCGSGRLLLGLLQQYGQVREFVGMDVHRPMIEWSQENLAPLSPAIKFLWHDVQNERYNPKGKDLLKARKWPLESDHFDLITLFSVFSHMWLKDIRHYLLEMGRVLSLGGKIFLTLFVEDDVPDEEENPPEYHREWKGRLHCIRLNRQTFEKLVREANLRVDYFLYRHTNDGQSSYVLSRKDQPPFRAKVVPG